ncbi:MAG: hypothetical protein L0Z50_15885 [Verrucomicrobiales bacterium]|nr:hypothetical protein [Verrucomicrobiales bacterium]
MKTSIKIGIGFVFVAAGSWFAYAAWRAHKNIVTLHVRNVPLAEAVRKIERQTRERICVDRRLDTTVTLEVANKPLVEVLDLIGEQAGALVTAVHAVHHSRAALQRLATALSDGDIAKAAGWTNIAPRLPEMDDTENSPGSNQANDIHSSGAGVSRGVTVGGDGVEVQQEVRMVNGPKGRRTTSESTPPMIVFRRVGSDDGGSTATTEIIVPERIDIEVGLARLLGEDAPASPSYENALETARKVKGRSTTLYALRKSAVGGLPNEALSEFRLMRSGGFGPGTPDRPRRSTKSIMAEAEDRARRANLDRYRKLTPEQRAQRMREQVKPQSQN